jgi:hypothetical protein
MDLGVMSDVDGQGALEDDLLHAVGLRIDAGELTEFRDEARAIGFGLREISGTWLDDNRGRLVEGFADSNQRAAEDLRVLAESRFD